MITTQQKPKERWRVATGVAQPPKDRVLQIVANIVDHDEFSTSVEPYEGLARWDDGTQDWLNGFGLSIRGFYESELVILEWTEPSASGRFILKEPRWSYPPRCMGPVSPLRALKPLPLALPAPAWMSDANHPLHENLYKLTDAQLQERMEAQDQFIRFLLDGKFGRAHLWYDHHVGASAIERSLEREAGQRWLRARHKARTQAKARREKKARASV